MNFKTAAQRSAGRCENDSWAPFGVFMLAMAVVFIPCLTAFLVPYSSSGLWWTISGGAWIVTGTVVGLMTCVGPVSLRRRLAESLLLWAAFGIVLFLAYIAFVLTTVDQWWR
jgi:hypothetical protein